MEFLGNLGSSAGSLLGYVIPFLFVLTIVVFFHELGHFLVARWAGVKVLTFSIGFGPELFGFNDRRGTRWKVSAIPLGGYVKFFGDENAASVPDQEAIAQMSEAERRDSFFHKSVGARAAIVAAGPIANFILAVVIFAGVFMLYGKQAAPARVDTIQANSAAAAAGFQPGDLVVEIDGRKIETFTDMQRYVSTHAGQTLDIIINRNGTQVNLKATPALTEIKDNFGNVHRVGVLGITGAREPPKPVDPLTAVKLGAEETWFVVERTMSYLAGVIVGRESADQLGGPIRIAQISGQVATAGIVALIHLAAVLSVSIGLLNLFPIPLLDGGHLLFYAAEALRGRPLGARAQEYGFRLGLALVLLLFVFATWNDLVHLRVVQFIQGLVT
jgi:regulator of sigma E protease